MAIERPSDLGAVYPFRRLSILDRLVHALEQIEIVLVAIRLEVEIGRDFGEPLVTDRFDVLLHEAVVIAPHQASRADRGLFRARGDLVGMQIVQAELVSVFSTSSCSMRKRSESISRPRNFIVRGMWRSI